MRSWRTVLVAFTVVAGAAACADQATAPPPQPPPPPPSPPGSGMVSLVTPSDNDGAVRLTLRGPGLTTLALSGSGGVFYQRLVSDSEARLIVVGNLTAGPLVSFKMADGQPVSAYSATLEQVASRGDSLRLSLSGYNLTVTVAP